MITRVIVGSKEGGEKIFKIFNLETAEGFNPEILYGLFHDPLIERIVPAMPAGEFLEVMYHNGVVDPEQNSILVACRKKGIEVEAAKVGYRYYGDGIEQVFVNKLVHMSFTEEPVLTTLKPRGVRQGMRVFDLTSVADQELEKLSKDRQLYLSLRQMQKLQEIQRRRGLKTVTDVFLETFAAFWSEHCFHTIWKSLGLLKRLMSVTEEIGRVNPNLLSAFEDNAGVWDFYGGLAILFKLETHNSPTQKEPFGGQLTKVGGVLRDIFENGLGAKPIGLSELTVVGEFESRKYPELEGNTLPAATIARETVRAIGGYGNPMGVPMLLARMLSHADFGGKVFALGGAFGITTREAAKKGRPQVGDLVVLVGGRTGNDGLHGATVSSGGITEETDTGDSCHVQIGNPYTEQLMMRAGLEIRDHDCATARNDFGAAGIVSAVGEMGKGAGEKGGVLVNLALVPLKCAGLDNWQIALSESQERFAHSIKPEKLGEAMEIYARYGLEATVIGVFTGNGRFQMVYDPELKSFDPKTGLSGEVALDTPYGDFDNCPLPDIKVVEPPKEKGIVEFPLVHEGNFGEMAARLVGSFDVCDQSWATRQYDSTVQGITVQGPLYGRNYDIPSHLGVLKPIFGQNYGLTVSMSFSPPQFEVDPVQAAMNMAMDAVVTQMIAGVREEDICLADNFYTPDKDPYAYYFLSKQVGALAEFSSSIKIPFITGKDSSAGSGTFGGRTVNVLPSVCITAMGKVPDVRKLIPHQWTASGNILLSLGPKARTLAGSVLASSLGLIGHELEGIGPADASCHLSLLSQLAASGKILSAVPVNRGGLFLRLFEGVEASGLGVQTDLLGELFPESFGTVLVEVSAKDAAYIERHFQALEPTFVGLIRPDQGLIVRGQRSDEEMAKVWSSTFKEVLGV